MQGIACGGGECAADTAAAHAAAGSCGPSRSPVNSATLSSIFTDRMSLGILLGLVVGKTIGVLGTAFIAVRGGLARLPGELHWRDLGAVSVLTGCVFTVSLLLAELAFGTEQRQDQAKGAVLIGSATAALLAAALLRRRARAHAG